MVDISLQIYLMTVKHYSYGAFLKGEPTSGNSCGGRKWNSMVK
jgi:hypothetical protein